MERYFEPCRLLDVHGGYRCLAYSYVKTRSETAAVHSDGGPCIEEIGCAARAPLSTQRTRACGAFSQRQVTRSHRGVPRAGNADARGNPHPCRRSALSMAALTSMCRRPRKNDSQQLSPAATLRTPGEAGRTCGRAGLGSRAQFDCAHSSQRGRSITQCFSAASADASIGRSAASRSSRRGMACGGVAPCGTHRSHAHMHERTRTCNHAHTRARASRCTHTCARAHPNLWVYRRGMRRCAQVSLAELIKRKHAGLAQVGQPCVSGKSRFRGSGKSQLVPDWRRSVSCA
jgi:hypothetical protein